MFKVCLQVRFQVLILSQIYGTVTFWFLEKYNKRVPVLPNKLPVEKSSTMFQCFISITVIYDEKLAINHLSIVLKHFSGVGNARLIVYLVQVHAAGVFLLRWIISGFQIIKCEGKGKNAALIHHPSKPISRRPRISYFY